MEAGACEFELYWAGGEVKVKFGKTFSSLVNPEIEPSDTALAITGIKKEELAQAPKWAEVRARLKEFIGEEIIVGHNVGFDMGYLGNQGMKLKNPLLDTLELGRTFLPLLESHSLESLAEGFAVLKDVPHRALVDCQNTARIGAEILNAFLAYPKKLQEEVKDILRKSPVHFIHMVDDLPAVHLARNKAEPLLAPEIKGEAADIEFVDKIIYCYPLNFNRTAEVLSDLASRPAAALIGHPYSALLNNLPRIPSPLLTLCNKRFSALLLEENLSENMAKILTKVTILQTMEQSLDLSQIKWHPDELMFLHYLTVNPRLCQKHGCSYPSLLKKKISQPVFGDLECIFELARRWSFPLTPRSTGSPLSPEGRGDQGGVALLGGVKPALLLFDLSAIEDKFTDSVSTAWNLKKIRNLFAPLYPVDPGQPSLMGQMPAEVETMLNELDLFFGILHLIYMKREGEFAENLVIDETERARERFEKLFHPAQKLKTKLENFSGYLGKEAVTAEGEMRLELEALAAAIEEIKRFTENFFLTAGSENICWLKFNSSWVDLNLQPRDVKKQWQKFSENFSSVTIVDTDLPGVSRTYYQNRLGLSAYDFKKCLGQKHLAQIPVKILSQSIPTANQAQFFLNLPGRSLLLVPNEGKLAEIYEMLSKNSDENLAVMAYKFSGSVAALKRKLKNFSGERLLLVLTLNAFVKHWENLPELHNLVIFRLPFEARGSKPTLLGLDDRSSFVDAILPRAISTLHRIMSAFLSAPGAKKEVFILDQRIINDYDQSFMKYFEEFPDFLISTVDNL